MTKTQREHVEEFGRIGALFNRAIASSSQREKDANLAELKKTSVDEVQTLEEQIITNEKKQKELEELTRNYEILKREHTVMQENQKLLDKIIQKNDKIDVKKMLDTISELENDIKAISQLQRPNLVKNVYSKNDRSGIRLYDVKLQRVEELIYALRKRILEVDKNEQYSSSIQSEFGNNTGLITTYNNLVKENEILKREEFQCSHDLLTKRRTITNMIDSSIRTMIVFMQQELDTEVKSIKILHEKDYSVDYNSIDTILNDKYFKQELPLEHPQKKINTMQASLQDVQNELKECKGLDPTMLKNAHDNEAKNLELMTYLLNKLTGISHSVDSASDCVQELSSQIFAMNRELRQAKLGYYKLFDPYMDLLDAHIKLIANQRKNISVNKSLSSVSSSMSLKNNNLKEFLEKAVFNYKLSGIKSPARTVGRKLTDVPHNNTTSKSKLKIHQISPAVPKAHSTVPSVEPSPAVSTANSAKISRNNSVTGQMIQEPLPRKQDDKFFNMLMSSILAEIMAPMYSRDAKRCTNIWTLLHDKFIVSIENTNKEFGDYLHSTIESIQKPAHEILVREKTETEVQTENSELFDIEIQTEDTKPLKGKK